MTFCSRKSVGALLLLCLSVAHAAGLHGETRNPFIHGHQQRVAYQRMLQSLAEEVAAEGGARVSFHSPHGPLTPNVQSSLFSNEELDALSSNYLELQSHIQSGNKAKIVISSTVIAIQCIRLAIVLVNFGIKFSMIVWTNRKLKEIQDQMQIVGEAVHVLAHEFQSFESELEEVFKLHRHNGLALIQALEHAAGSHAGPSSLTHSQPNLAHSRAAIDLSHSGGLAHSSASPLTQSLPSSVGTPSPLGQNLDDFLDFLKRQPDFLADDASEDELQRKLGHALEVSTFKSQKETITLNRKGFAHELLLFGFVVPFDGSAIVSEVLNPAMDAISAAAIIEPFVFPVLGVAYASYNLFVTIRKARQEYKACKFAVKGYTSEAEAMILDVRHTFANMYVDILEQSEQQTKNLQDLAKGVPPAFPEVAQKLHAFSETTVKVAAAASARLAHFEDFFTWPAPTDPPITEIWGANQFDMDKDPQGCRRIEVRHHQKRKEYAQKLFLVLCQFTAPKDYSNDPLAKPHNWHYGHRNWEPINRLFQKGYSKDQPDSAIAWFDREFTTKDLFGMGQCEPILDSQKWTRMRDAYVYEKHMMAGVPHEHWTKEQKARHKYMSENEIRYDSRNAEPHSYYDPHAGRTKYIHKAHPNPQLQNFNVYQHGYDTLLLMTGRYDWGCPIHDIQQGVDPAHLNDPVKKWRVVPVKMDPHTKGCPRVYMPDLYYSKNCHIPKPASYQLKGGPLPSLRNPAIFEVPKEKRRFRRFLARKFRRRDKRKAKKTGSVPSIGPKLKNLKITDDLEPVDDDGDLVTVSSISSVSSSDPGSPSASTSASTSTSLTGSYASGGHLVNSGIASLAKSSRK